MNTILLTIAFLIDLIFQYECNEISSSPIFIKKKYNSIFVYFKITYYKYIIINILF